MNKIKELCARRGIDQKEVALQIGVSRPTVSNWFNQKINPKDEHMERLCKLLNATEDEILGREKISHPDANVQADLIPISEQLKALRKVKRLSQDAVADACGISRLTLARYENGDTVPKASALAALAQYYDVPLSHLTACVDVQSKKSAAVSDSADSRARAIYEIELEFGKLSEEKLWESLRYMKYLETTD